MTTFVITATPRSGTQWLANTLKQILPERFTVAHEGIAAQMWDEDNATAYIHRAQSIPNYVEVNFFATYRMDLWQSQEDIKYLHILRHPHDVAKSMYKVGMDPYDRAAWLWMKVQVEMCRWPIQGVFHIEDLWRGDMEVWAEFISHFDLEPYESIDGGLLQEICRDRYDVYSHIPDVEQDEDLPLVVRQFAAGFGYAVRK